MKRGWAGPIVLVLLCAGFYWKLFTDQYTWLNGTDLSYMEVPRFQFQAQEWRQGRMPLWDPHHWGGQPLLGQVIGAAYPPNWLFLALPYRGEEIPQRRLHWYYVVAHVAAGLAMYSLCLHLRVSRSGSVIGGLSYTLGGFLATADWPQLMNAMIWGPLALQYLIGRTGLRSAVVSGGFLGIAWLSGHHEVPLYVTLAWIAIAWWDRGWRTVAVGLAAAGMVGALQILPAMEYGPLAVRWVGGESPIGWRQRVPYTVDLQHAFPPWGLLGFVMAGVSKHVDLFVGVMGAALFWLAGWSQWARREVRLLAACAVGALLLAMAGVAVWHGIFYWALPGFEKARVPARWLSVFSLAVSPLIAVGVDSLRMELDRRRVRWIAGACALYGLIVLVVLAVRGDGDERRVLSGVMGLVAALVLGAGLRSPVLVGLLLLTELSNVAGWGFPHASQMTAESPWRRLHAYGDVAGFLKKQPDPKRVYLAADEMQANYGDWWGVDVWTGFSASVTENVFRLDWAAGPMQDLLGINYTVAAKPVRDDQVQVFAGADGMNVYRNPGALGRAWIVHEAERVNSKAEINIRVNGRTVDPRRKALLLGAAPELQRCDGSDTVEFIKMQAADIRLRATTGCRAMLLLGDTYFPGWRVEIDGKRGEILEAFASIRVVVLEAGTHDVHFQYLPWSVVLGGASTLLGLVAMGIAAKGVSAADRWQ